MTQEEWYIVLYVLIIIPTMVIVVMEKRQPMKTVAWLLVLAFVPIVGLVFYFFFGQNIRKERYIARHSLDKLMRKSMIESGGHHPLQLPERNQKLIQLFASQDLALPSNNNVVDIYTSARKLFDDMLKEIDEAKQHIHISTYIIDDDELGRRFAEVLKRKAEEGVEVRLVYDSVGCLHTSRRFFQQIKDAGAEVASFMPVRFPFLTRRINYRNHRKLCIVDGVVGYIGGMNIAQRYIDGTGEQPWHDLHARVMGGAVQAMQHVFEEDWYFSTKLLLNQKKYYPQPDVSVDKACLAQVVTSSPASQWHNIMQGYVRILLEARKYVYMETPYFMPTEPILNAMRTAALSGVDVRLILPLHGDSKIVEWASQSYLSEVVKAGVKVYLYKAGFLHSKMLVSDDAVCTCGSSNVDFRSFENNFECNLFLYGEEMAKQMKNVFLSDQKDAMIITLSNLRRYKKPFMDRFMQSLSRLLSPLL